MTADPSPVDDGNEPDYRFTLANERTFLAWVRTSLALLAGGLAVSELVDPFPVSGGREALAVGALAASAATTILGYHHWRTSQRAMRLGRPLPSPVGVPVLAAALVALAAAAAALVVA